MDFSGMSATEVCEWLEEKGFSEEVVGGFRDNIMDGDAILMAISSTPGHNCLQSVVPQTGPRLKVYNEIKTALEQLELNNSLDSDDVLAAKTSIGCSQGFQSPPSRSESVFSHATVSNRSVSVSPILQASPKASSVVSTISVASSSKATKLPQPFVIPMFRRSTQEMLEKKRFADDDRIHMVSMIGHIVCATIGRVNTWDCEIAARALVRKYPFLKEHYSWQQYIYVKCQNINRIPGSSKHDVATGPASKRRKVVDTNKHSYPSLGVEFDDHTSNERNKQELKKELDKTKPSKDRITELMKRTFGRRRSWILDEAASVREICREYVLLKKSAFISIEFDLIMTLESSRDKFEESWVLWRNAVMDYVTAMKNVPAALRNGLRVIGDDKDNECIQALLSMAYFLTAKPKKKVNNDKIIVPYLLWEVPRGTPDSEAIDCDNNQPYIVRLFETDADISSQYYIVIEQELMIECSSLISAMYTLLAVHYVFNLEYHVRLKDFFMFIERKILGLSSTVSRCSASYLSFTSGAECYLQLDD